MPTVNLDVCRVIFQETIKNIIEKSDQNSKDSNQATVELELPSRDVETIERVWKANVDNISKDIF